MIFDQSPGKNMYSELQISVGGGGGGGTLVFQNKHLRTSQTCLYKHTSCENKFVVIIWDFDQSLACEYKLVIFVECIFCCFFCDCMIILCMVGIGALMLL